MSLEMLLLATVGLIVLIVLQAEISLRGHWPSATMFIALFGFLWMTIRYSPPTDTRVLSLGMAALGLLVTAYHGRLRFRFQATAVIPFALVLASAIWSDGAAVEVLAQVVFTIALLVAISVRTSERILVNALAMVFVFTLAATALVMVADPGAVRLAGRLAGPFVNPNTLGAILILTFPAAVKTAPRLIWLSSGVTLAVVWETGSRAALLAALIQVLVVVWLRMVPALRPFAVLTALIVTYQVAPTLLATIESEGEGSNSVLRSNNSRESVWSQSLELIREKPVFGHGLAAPATTIETGSSVLSAALIGGVVLLVVTVACVALLLLRHLSSTGLRDWRTATIIGGLVNSSFEGWLLTASSIFCIVFWLVATNTADAPRTDTATSAGGTGLIRDRVE